MLSLQLLTGFHVLHASSHAVHLVVHWMQHVFSGNIGFASLACPKRLFLTGTLNLQVHFGKSCLD